MFKKRYDAFQINILSADVISKEEFTVIHTLKNRGYSIRAIVRTVGLDRRTVAKRLRETDLRAYKKITYKSKLDPYKEYITNRVQQALPDKIPSTVIFKEIKKYGYDGHIGIIQTYKNIQLRQLDTNSIISLVRLSPTQERQYLKLMRSLQTIRQKAYEVIPITVKNY